MAFSALYRPKNIAPYLLQVCWTRFKVCLCFIVLFHGVILGLLSQVQPKKVWFWTGLWMTFPGLSWIKIVPYLLPCVLSKMVKCLVVSSYHDQNPASVIAAENLLDYISKFRVGESHVEHTSHVAVVKDSHSQYGEWPKPENQWKKCEPDNCYHVEIFNAYPSQSGRNNLGMFICHHSELSWIPYDIWANTNKSVGKPTKMLSYSSAMVLCHLHCWASDDWWLADF